ncbi:MAG: discoidin domain-containing protein [Clostridiales bacterium]|nr:discoidin domain-containing protein [Clostridiales bacterium]
MKKMISVKRIISAICAVGMLAAVSAGFAGVSAEETQTSYVLTNNRLEMLHPGISNFDIGLSYEIFSDGSNGGGQAGNIINNDSGFTKLTDGNYSKNANNATNGGWLSDDKNWIIADPKTGIYITGAEFYATNAKNVDILYSTDGTTYISLGAVQEKSDAYDGATSYSVSCEPTKARYIKFYSERDAGNEIITEFVVKGYMPDNSKLLTNNDFYTFEPSMQRLNTGLTYKIESKQYGEGEQGGNIVKNDLNCTKLTDGIPSGNDSTYMAMGGWQTDDDVTVTADAKTNVYITGADFYASGAKDVKISYSLDGLNYTALATPTVTEPSDGPKTFSVSCLLKLARYIKFESHRDGDQMNIYEIAVKGYPAEFSFGGTKFDSTAKTFDGFLVNKPDTDTVTPEVITAVYDKAGRLVAAKNSNVSVAANSSATYSASFGDTDIESGYSIKSFAWTNLSEIKPLAQMTEYTVE